MITTHVIYFVTLGPHRQTKRVSEGGLHHNRTVSGLKSDIVLNTNKKILVDGGHVVYPPVVNRVKE